MTPPEQHHGHHDPVERLWSEAAFIDGIAKRGEEALTFAYDRRAEVWAGLVEQGVEQKDIAERFGIDPSDVSRALSSRAL